MERRFYCAQCDASSMAHIGTWVDDIFDRILPDLSEGPVMSQITDILIRGLEVVLRIVGLARFVRNPDTKDLPPRLAYFASAVRRAGGDIDILKGPAGFTYNARVTLNGKTTRVEGFPRGGGAHLFPIDDKNAAKTALSAAGFPVPQGRAFWSWQKRAARAFAERAGYPLVVKPRGGSVARHVSCDIRDSESFDRAVGSALSYAPTFIVERYFKKGFVHRATVVDYESVFCARQLPAHVTGDGMRCIEDLIAAENTRRKAGGNPLAHEIVFDSASEDLLRSRARTLRSVPAAGEVVFLQRDPFVRLGGDIEEVTDKVHPKNKEFFISIARAAGARVVGMDVILEDVSKAWNEQECAILELNSLPCIEMHHQPSCGQPQDVAGALVKMMQKENG